MSERLYLYPKWLRIWHWTNALLFLVLIFSGLSLQYSSQSFQIIRFDIAVTIHNIAGIALTVSFLFFLITNAFSKNYRFYKVKRKGFLKRLIKQFRYYLFGVFKKESVPYPVSKKRKFNPLQKLSYIVVMYVFMPLVVITGMALMFPETIIPNVFGFSGIHLTDLLHIIIGFTLSIFMIVHIYFCTFGKSPIGNFKSMFNGWHESH